MKQKVFNIIQSNSESGSAGRIYGIALAALILLTVVAVFLDTFALPEWAEIAITVFDVFSVTVFTIDYALRIWTADLLFPQYGQIASRLRYMFSFMGLIDLISILPFYLPILAGYDLRILRLFRVFRLLTVFKLGHFFEGTEEIGEVIEARRGQLVSSILVIAVLIVISSVLMFYVEHEAQPDMFENALDSLWWAIATLTTIGYGDIYPVTALGKIIAAVVALLGVGLVAVPSGIISAGLMEVVEKRKSSKSNNPEN